MSRKAGKIVFRYFQMGVPSQSLLDTEADSYYSKVLEGNGMNRKPQIILNSSFPSLLQAFR